MSWLMDEAVRLKALPAFRYASARVLVGAEALADTVGEAAALAPGEVAAWVAVCHRAAGVVGRLGDWSAARGWLRRAEPHLGSDRVAWAEDRVLRARAVIWGDAARHAAEVGGEKRLRLAEDLSEGDEAASWLARAEDACSVLPEDAGVRGRLTLAHAERLTFTGRPAYVPMLLEGYVRRGAEVGRTDDHWRALWLLGNALRETGRYEEAGAQYRAAAELCDRHDAPDDAADARVAQGRAMFGAGRPEEGMELIRAAHSGLAAESPALSGAAAAELTATMASGDLDAVASVARARALEAVERGDARVYFATVEIVVHIYRARREYELAYRLLLAVYGHAIKAFGPGGARPLLMLTEVLKRDLGDAGFEALAGRILAAVH